MSDRKYYIQDTRTYCGDSVLWWREGGAGYTIDLDEAGEFDEERARSIQRNRSTDRPIPVEIARAAASAHVTAGSLRKAESVAAYDSGTAKRIKVHVHGEEESMYDSGKDAGLTGGALLTFSRSLYEVAIDLDVDPSTGKATIATVGGRLLAPPRRP
jgi:hypothetical protein